MNLETKITIYKFTPQVFTLTRFLLQIIHHLVTVVGTHRDGNLTALLQLEESLHHMVHVDVAFQMVGFVEVAFLIALRATQVHEVDAVAELFHQGGTVIGAAYAQRTGAQAQTVALVGNSVNQSLEIGAAAHDTRQAQD